MSLGPLTVDLPSRIWRSGGMLIFWKAAELPRSCVRCNAPTENTVRRRVSWHHPGLYLLLVNVVIYIVAALAARKTADLLVPVCDRHQRRRRWALIVGWLVGLSGLVACFVGLGLDSVPVALLGLYAFCGAAVHAVVGSRLFTVVHVDEHLVRLRGVDPAWLRDVPPWDVDPEVTPPAES
ncbi:MAG TPA: hypothetical protein VFK70_09150 [Vicinamibacteria bacterium]|nr:hypothetical protein [Vicinamibacteria bacterium]